MSFYANLQQTRNATSINASVAVQIDNMSIQEVTGLGGAEPYDSFWIYTLDGPIDAQRGDLFMDLNNNDPKTGTNAIYRVFSNPEPFDDHSEIAGEKVVGT